VVKWGLDVTHSALAVEGSLEAFFFSQVGEAQTRTGASLPREVEAYVVHLLADCARRPALAGRRSGPLALQYLSARAAGGQRPGPGPAPGRRPGPVHRRRGAPQPRPHAVDLRYVRSLGSDAYRQISDGHGPLAVFNSLADRFEVAAEVISEATDPRGEADRDLLGLYERWRRYGEARDARRLVAAGVVLDPDGADTLQ
jgi:hypothetical protein